MSQKLTDVLNLKTLMFPYWFGHTAEQWEPLQMALQEFQDETVVDLVTALLEIEDSVEYWQDATAWPYPDQRYIHSLCEIIDDNVPLGCVIEAKTFMLAWSLQSIRNAMSASLIRVQRFRNLNKQ